MTRMRFLHIDPSDHRVKPVEADTPHMAHPKLTIGNVDHGVVHMDPDRSGIGIIVYEYGLLEAKGPYFAINGQLYAGDAVLYAFDYAGETVDMPQRLAIPEPLWLDTNEDVELAIAAGAVARPQTAVNGAVLWRWGEGGAGL